MARQLLVDCLGVDWLVVFLMAAFVPALAAQSSSDDETAIRKVLAVQVQAWNDGDIDSFMNSYDNSPDTTFVSNQVHKGYPEVLARYKKQYPTTEKMGSLEFSELEVRLLGNDYAYALGRFHLERSAKDGGPVSGIFSLIFNKREDGWKIILDHTH